MKIANLCGKICDMCTLLKCATNVAVCEICGNHIFAWNWHAWLIVPTLSQPMTTKHTERFDILFFDIFVVRRILAHVRFSWKITLIIVLSSPLSNLWTTNQRASLHTHTHTHTRLTALFPGLPRWAGTRKVKPIWILLKQETVSGSGISWATCKSAPHSRQIPHQHPTAQFFIGRMPFLPPNQQRQSTEGTASLRKNHPSCKNYIANYKTQ